MPNQHLSRCLRAINGMNGIIDGLYVNVGSMRWGTVHSQGHWCLSYSSYQIGYKLMLADIAHFSICPAAWSLSHAPSSLPCYGQVGHHGWSIAGYFTCFKKNLLKNKISLRTHRVLKLLKNAKDRLELTATRPLDQSFAYMLVRSLISWFG